MDRYPRQTAPPSPPYDEKLALVDERFMSSDTESESSNSNRRREFDSPFSKIALLSTVKSYQPQGLPRAPSIRISLLKMGIFLLPSFVQHRFTRDRRAGPEKLHPTAYLDGMRGLAALFVFFCHYSYTAFFIHEAWGHEDSNYEIWKLPFLRLLYSGPSMVCVFFVISGYALSFKPLKQIRSRSFDGFAGTITSFTFRRPFRLFLPTMVSTFMILVLLRLGAFEGTRAFTQDPNFMHNVKEPHPLLMETTRKQIHHWAWEMYNFVHIWSWENHGGSTSYDVHLWTIPVEFRCSMVLFLTLCATARLRTWARFLCVGVFAWFVLRNDRWEMLLFLGGMTIAEMDLIQNTHGQSQQQQPLPSSAPPSGLLPLNHQTGSSEGKAPKTISRRQAIFWTLVAVPALYLMSEPDMGTEGVPGWGYLGARIPEWFSDKYRYWQMWGAILFVFCAARSPWWQHVFNTAPVQYFGRISYAIYLMHGPVTHIVGYRVQRLVFAYTGVEEWTDYRRGFLLAAVVNVPLVVWAADVFWRAVDAPIVRFTRWLEGKLSVSE
ncbi:acyltransferase [Biscogniauxia mediterranea]|nr:acyltransferase [Biscogniauxia mediterranea]